MTKNQPTFAFSLIIPLYKSEEIVGKLVSRLEALDFSGFWQVIFVDDGSPDQTYSVLKQRLQKSPLTSVLVRHTRNFGEHQAVLTGYRHSEGEYFINIDDDLQNPPEEALLLLQHASLHGLDVVYGNYIEKKHGLFRNLGSGFANLTARILLDLPDTYYLSSFRCVRGLIGKKIAEVSSPYVYIDGLLSQATQQIASLDVQHDQRYSGVSNYNLRRLIRLWLVILTGFSLMPLRIASFIGILASAIGTISLTYVLINSFFGNSDVAGWLSVISAILFFGGIQCLLLGLLGEYVGRIYLTVYGKPQSLIRTLERYGFSSVSSQLNNN